MNSFVRARRAARWLSLPLGCALLPCAAAAQTLLASSATLDTVVVTATRVEQKLEDVVADVSVIERDTIERSGATTVADLLTRLPGVEFVRNGGPTANTSVFVRGADNRHTAVFIDGVRVDSQSTGGANWNALPAAQIDRIEILRGPAAAIYGSDAIAGVVQIFTRQGTGPFTPSIGLGLGSHRTRKADAGFHGKSGAVDYALSVGHETSDGFDARPGVGFADRDGYRSTSASGRLGWTLNQAHRLEATALFSDVNTQYDGFASTADDRALNEVHTLGVSWNARWSDTYRMRLSANRGRDQYETRPSPYVTDTKVDGYLWHHELQFGAHRLTAALERRVDRLDNSGPPAIDASRSQNALALGYGWTDHAHTVQLNVRHDDDSEFGGKTTGAAAYAYAFAPGWRVTGSAGTAFRAPTLYQRFSQYGVADLKPESSRNLEAGLRYAQGATQFGLVVFRNEVTDLINFGAAGPCASAFGCYENAGKAILEGVTLSGAHRLGGVNLWGSVDVQNPRNADTDRILARRARRHAQLGADTVLGGWTVGADLKLVGERFDNASNTVRLGGYGLVNLHASRTLARDWTVLARVDNLADKDYEVARTYATGGRMVFVGLRWSPR
ncbi:MAG: outer membrane protein [Caldimonas sp.]|nr:MAG: outer membrane protein [Caldimonas sp.]